MPSNKYKKKKIVFESSIIQREAKGNFWEFRKGLGVVPWGDGQVIGVGTGKGQLLERSSQA